MLPNWAKGQSGTCDISCTLHLKSRGKVVCPARLNQGTKTSLKGARQVKHPPKKNPLLTETTCATRACAFAKGIRLLQCLWMSCFHQRDFVAVWR